MPTTSGPERWNTAAIVVAVITVAMIPAYAALMRSQDDSPLLWVVGLLALAACLAAYGAYLPAPGGALALTGAGALLVVMGVLGLFSIGLPLLVAGVMANVSAWTRLRRPRG